MLILIIKLDSFPQNYSGTNLCLSLNYFRETHEMCVTHEDNNCLVLLMSAKNKNVHKTGNNRVMKLVSLILISVPKIKKI